MTIATLFSCLLMAACQPDMARRDAVRTLDRPILACRERGTLAALATAGPRFQRLADDALASGACRRFAAGETVRVLPGEAGHARLADPRSGMAYWAGRF